MLTLHVRSRVFPQLEDAAQFIKAIIGMYDVFMENKRIKAAQAVANLVEVDSAAAAAAVAAEAAAMEADVQVSFVVCHSALHAAAGDAKCRFGLMHRTPSVTYPFPDFCPTVISVMHNALRHSQNSAMFPRARAWATIIKSNFFYSSSIQSIMLLAGTDSCRYCSQAAQHNQDQ